LTTDYRPRHLSPVITHFRRLRILAWLVRMQWQTGVALWQQQRALIRDGRIPERLR
jgi:hypothetical protein